MLVYARKEIGYTIEQAADAIGVSSDTLALVESGKHCLTLNQLRNAAEKYDFPLGYFYLSSPPPEKSFKPIPDFRVEPSLHGVDHYRLNLEIKKCRERRNIFIDLAARLEMEVKPFQLLPDESARNVGSLIRERLGVLDTDFNTLKFEDTYAYWKNIIERDGVLVYESQYIPDKSGVIGAAMFYDTYPIILIKRGGNFNERKLFTLLHEYAHLLLGKSAINDAGAQVVRRDDPSVDGLEARCNALAGEILIPAEKIDLSVYTGLAAADKMELLSRTFKVTYTTAAVCLRKLQLISNTEFIHLLDLRRKANETKSQSKGEGARIPRENLMRLDMGRPMFKTVLEAYSVGLLDIFDTSKILNLRVKKIDGLVSGLRR
jgi:Zn-dependent peptidase ImmA (M78 family)